MSLDLCLTTGSVGPVRFTSTQLPLAHSCQSSHSFSKQPAIDEVGFKVEPFKLPRFRIEANADKPYYRASDKPTIKGAVIYASGAPVGNAKVEITWSFDGAWPPPLDWEEKLLPKQATVTTVAAWAR